MTKHTISTVKRQRGGRTEKQTVTHDKGLISLICRELLRSVRERPTTQYRKNSKTSGQDGR